MDQETIGIPATSMDPKQQKRESEILEQSETNIEKYRTAEFTIDELKPNEDYEIVQVDTEFSFGTSLNVLQVTSKAAALAQVEKRIEEDPEKAEEYRKWIDYLQACDDEYISGYIRTLRSFNCLVPEEPFLWVVTDRHGFDLADDMIKFIRENAPTYNLRGHCLFWNRISAIPDRFKGDDPNEIPTDKKEELKKAAIERVEEMVTRYPDVKEWVVVNEALLREPRSGKGDHRGVEKEIDRNASAFDPVEDIDFFVELFKAAKRANPEARLLINEYDLLNGEKTEEYISFIQNLIERGAPVDGVGVQGHIRGENFADLVTSKENLERLSALGIPIDITEFDVSDQAIRDHYFSDGSGSDDSIEERRAKYVADMLTVFYGDPNVASVNVWGFQDKVHWRGDERSGLFDENFNPNKVGQRYLQKVHTDWRTRVEMQTDDNGTLKFRGFRGKYLIKNKNTGEEKTVDLRTKDRKNEGEHFFADQDVVDSIKLETSDLTPIEMKRIEETADEMIGYILEEFDEFIPSEMKDLSRDFKKRILKLNPGAYEGFFREWSGVSNSRNTYGFKLLNGEFVVLTIPEEFWDKHVGDGTRETIIDRSGHDQEKARNRMEKIIIDNIILHELIHMYQDNTLPRDFVEAVVRYCHKDVCLMNKIDMVEMGTEYRKDIEKVEKLYEKLGGDVYSVIFGSASEEVRERVLDDFRKLDEVYSTN